MDFDMNRLLQKRSSY